MANIPFEYTGTGDILKEARAKNLNIPTDNDVPVLGLGLGLGHGSRHISVKNRFVAQPMESCNANPKNGAPSMHTYTKYERLAKGGSAIIWLEAIAVSPDCRSNPYQLCLTEQNVDAFKKLVLFIKKTGFDSNGFAPLVIAQLNHSGRFCSKDGKLTPKAMYKNPLYEKTVFSPETVITDDELKQVEIDMGKAACLAQKAGFDVVDIKACHGHLVGESLSAFERPGHYGGDFINRTRLFKNCIESAIAQTKNYFFTTRMNIYDSYAYPFGFGVSSDGSGEPDTSEPIAFAKTLIRDYKFNLFNFVCGNPYVNPDMRGLKTGETDPLKAISQRIELTKAVAKPLRSAEAHVVISSMGYLRHFIPFVGAGILHNSCAELIGLGRPLLAYPDMPNDILKKSGCIKEKACIACSKCAELKSKMMCVGCAVHDRENFDI